jgi:hypothetical protein
MIKLSFSVDKGWRNAERTIAQWPRRVPKAIDAAAAGVAHQLRRFIVRAFVKQGEGVRWDPLSTLTLALRTKGSLVGRSSFGGSKALIQSGDLRRAVTARKGGKGADVEYFVGLHRGSGVSDIGKVHEQYRKGIIGPGRVFKIPISDAMRRLFLYWYIQGVISAPLSAKKTHIIIRQRSFVWATWKAKRSVLVKLGGDRFRSVMLTGKVGPARVR